MLSIYYVPKYVVLEMIQIGRFVLKITKYSPPQFPTQLQTSSLGKLDTKLPVSVKVSVNVVICLFVPFDRLGISRKT